MEQNVKTIFSRIDQQLDFVASSFIDLTKTPHDPKLRLRSLANIITFGRSVTFVMQNLRSSVTNFDDWYKPFQDEMKGDELLIFFKDARNKLEKQGRLDTNTTVHMKNFNFNMIQKYRENPPENAKGFFIGDSLGGSGWEILMPDNTVEKLYVDLDIDCYLDIKILFVPENIHHKGQLITDTSIENCCYLFLQYLKELVKQAKEQFLTR